MKNAAQVIRISCQAILQVLTPSSFRRNEFPNLHRQVRGLCLQNEIFPRGDTFAAHRNRRRNVRRQEEDEKASRGFHFIIRRTG